MSDISQLKKHTLHTLLIHLYLAFDGWVNERIQLMYSPPIVPLLQIFFTIMLRTLFIWEALQVRCC